MKPRFASRPRLAAAYALLVALVFVGVSLLLLTSLLAWTSGNTLVTDRNNAYNRAVGAAEAATEMALARMARDFKNQTFNPANTPVYRGCIPTNAWAAEYEFSDGAGGVNQIWVDCSPAVVLTNLDSALGLTGQVYVCRARADVRLRSPDYPRFGAAVRQDFQLASVPIFQFAIYYGLDLELNPYELIVKGKVHGNADLYTSPGYRLEFADAVEAAGRIYYQRHPDDPGFSTGILPVFDGFHQEKVGAFALPLATNAGPADVRKILLEPPPAEESPTSPVGKQRYYNRADVIVTATPTNWTARFNVNGDGTSFLPAPDTNAWGGTNFTFLTTNAFWDYREGKTVSSLDLNIGNFNLWMAGNPLGRPLRSLYVNDQRAVAGNQLAALRLVNAGTLVQALTVATARPLYVKGDFNRSNPKPASLAGDAITVLSANWQDTYGPGTTVLDRDAQSDLTLNAALLAGIVPTANVGGVKRYSGGAENFLRLLENWSAEVNPRFTFNGSIAALFASRYATNFWKNPGSVDNCYNPPNPSRYLWTFDTNLLNWTKLPPLTPQVQKIVRGRWQILAAGSPN
jgi:hypothetical protein